MPFGTEDTHPLIHTFRWGIDSRLSFNQSISIHSHVETPSGMHRLNGGGMWRFCPSSLDLAVFARGWVNPWGEAIDPWGRSLVTDGDGGEGINLGFPGAAHFTAAARRAAPGPPATTAASNDAAWSFFGSVRASTIARLRRSTDRFYRGFSPRPTRELYRREHIRCVACRRIDREGGHVGPNLTAIGSAAQPDYFLEAFLEPGKSVKESYGSLVVVTTDG